MAIGKWGYHAASALLKGFALATLCGAADAAFAAPPDQAALFRGYIAAPSYRAILAKAYLDDEPAALKAQCKTLDLVSLDPPEIVETPVFVPNGGAWRTQAGAWVLRATLDKCGTKVLRRVLVETKSDNTLRTRALLPGEFAGGYKVEQSAQSLVTYSMMSVTDCKDWKTEAVSDIKLTAGTVASGHWTETWTAQMCGKTVTAKVDYTRKSNDAGDVDIVTSAVKAR